MLNKLNSVFSGIFTTKMIVKTACFFLVLMLVTTNAYAAAASPAGMDSFDKVIDIIATWLGRIGLVVAFFGGIQLALGFKNDDADGKVRGMKTLASGFLVYGLTQSLALFGL